MNSQLKKLLKWYSVKQLLIINLLKTILKCHSIKIDRADNLNFRKCLNKLIFVALISLLDMKFRKISNLWLILKIKL